MEPTPLRVDKIGGMLTDYIDSTALPIYAGRRGSCPDRWATRPAKYRYLFVFKF
jgi:hypothetical protein